MPRNLIEEKWNSITHAVMLGFFLSTSLVSESVSVVVYSLGMTLAMFFSTIYHGIEDPTLKGKLRKCDMMSIHVGISTSGASYILCYGNGNFLLPVVLVGVLGMCYIYANFGKGKFEDSVAFSFLLFGLAVALLTLSGLIVDQQIENIKFFVIGILFYLTGLVFYVKDEREWYHTVWHLFVMGASLVHLYGLL